LGFLFPEIKIEFEVTPKGTNPFHVWGRLGFVPASVALFPFNAKQNRVHGFDSFFAVAFFTMVHGSPHTHI
jgi:hypothetical protein